MLEDGILTPLSPLWAKAVTAIKAIDDAVSKPNGTVTMVSESINDRQTHSTQRAPRRDTSKNSHI